MKKPAITPSNLADSILDRYLSPRELYGEMLDLVSAKDFQRMEDAIIATWAGPRDDNERATERAIATQEVFFMLGLELGKRIGGVR